MKQWDTLINEVAYRTKSGTNPTITQVDFDSRKVQSGSVYVAIKGTTADGHQFIDMAIQQGAAAIVAEQLPENRSEEVAYLEVENSRLALAKIAAAFYEYPSRQLQLIGVTGTNGKTTVTTLLFDLFRKLGYHCGLLSTVANRIEDKVLPAKLTTPDAVSLQALLAEMVEAGCDYAFMEVSSHAIDQERTAALAFKGAVFTNLTHDHLDYHGTFKAYLEAKKRLFDQLPKTAFALVNTDDKHGLVMLQNTKATRLTFSGRRPADYRVRILSNTIHGLDLELGGQQLSVALVGKFNAYNLLSAFAVADQLGQIQEEVLAALSSLRPAAGRFELVHGHADQPTAIVDYAHTPDALEQVLETIQAVRTPGTRILTVVGCGGDRDRTKRPKMAQVATRLSDYAILTSDNPRTEDPETILKDMEQGLSPADQVKVWIEPDRKKAIAWAVKQANAKDIILIAGKGHEDYQEINGVRHPFDDRLVVKAMIS